MNPTLMSMSSVQRLLHNPDQSLRLDQTILFDTGFTPDRSPLAETGLRFQPSRQSSPFTRLLDWLAVPVGTPTRTA